MSVTELSNLVLKEREQGHFNDDHIRSMADIGMEYATQFLDNIDEIMDQTILERKKVKKTK